MVANRLALYKSLCYNVFVVMVFDLRGFSPAPVIPWLWGFSLAGVEQWSARLSDKQEVVSSNLTPSTI